MAATTILTPTDKLAAVNICLTNLGESPVADLDSNIMVDAQIASDIVDEISREVQSTGWNFNTETHTLTPDVSGNLAVPTATLKADSTGNSRRRNLVLRNTRMYDKDNNTYAFTGAVTLELVLFLDFDELPETARRLIALRAARVFQERQLGNDSLSQENQQDENRAWAAMIREEAQSGDYNLLNNPIMARIARR